MPDATMRTACGRRIAVGVLRLDGVENDVGIPATRVTLDIDCASYDRDEVWASLTPAEARHLAGELLANAAEAERRAVEPRDLSPMDGVRPVGRIDVVPVTGESYTLTVRGHRLLVDQPADTGGTDTAATPTELFIASLASCVAFYAGRYLTRHGVARDGLRVTAEYDMALDRPARVSAVRLAVTPPPELPAERRPALLAVARRCTVHNTLAHPPRVDIDLSA